MTDRALEQAARLLSRRVGLRSDPAIRARLTRAVRDEAERRDLDVASYVARLDTDGAALQDLLDRVTVQETSFFRDPGQFDALARDVLPTLASTGRPVRVWSAGCANGQEAYSLAMVLAESDLPGWEVVATDISTRALRRTERARYQQRELSGLTPERRDRFMVERGAEWEVVPTLRSRVSVQANNLAVDPPPVPPGLCDVVFCRNVLIYFGRDDVVALLRQWARWLPPGAYLFLGYSETLWQVTDHFELVRLGDAFVYRNGPAARGPMALSASLRTMAPRRLDPPPLDRPPLDRPPESAAPPAAAVKPHADQDRPEPAIVVGPPDDGSAGAAMEAGAAALARGDPDEAVRCFRRAVYLDSDLPLAHLHLGLALEEVGQDVAARRSFAAARAALDRVGPGALEEGLEGYHVDELIRLLETKAGS